MVWLWLLVPLVILVLTLGLRRATTTLRRERADLQTAVDALGPLAERIRRAHDPETPRRAIGRASVDR